MRPGSASGLVARRTIQAPGSNYPRFRVKMFGMSVGVVRVWTMSDVQVICMPIFTCKQTHDHSERKSNCGIPPSNCQTC